MKLFREIFSGKITFHVALITASVLFVYFCSTSTSPRYEFLGDDSAIFQAVGKGWAEGHLPYVELFENKGALIFLIDALGYMIYPRIGIFILQIPAMYLSMLFAWRALGLYLSGKARFAAALFMLIFDAMYYLDGNRTEEWSMPFLMVATYFYLRGLKKEKFTCPPLVGFIYGLGFGACVLLRTTNALPICCYVFLSAIFLIRANDFKILWRNAVNFCAGFVLIVLPFVIYFAAHDAIYDMLYGTIILNVAYSAQRGSFLMTHFDEFAVYIVIHFMPLYLMLAVSATAFIKNKSHVAMSGLFCGAAMLTLLMKSSPYLGYCTLITPLLPIFFIVLAERMKNFRALSTVKGLSLKRMAYKSSIVILIIYPLILGNIIISHFRNMNSDSMAKYIRNEIADMKRLAEYIPPEERGSVMIWSEGLHASHWILVTGIFPRYLFFNNVKAFANVEPNIKREWLETARDNPPQWIIYSAHISEFSGEETAAWTKYFRQNRDLDVERLLQDGYRLEAEMETYMDSFMLYKLKR